MVDLFLAATVHSDDHVRCSTAPAAAAAAWEISIFMLRGYTGVSAPQLLSAFG